MFSVIVPVYNVEKYLDETIESVLGDDFKDIELILVNDGSKDKSGEICKRAAETDSRVIFVDKENGGVASARNAGINVSTGKYLMFLDSDDKYEKGTFLKVAKAISETDCDICQFGFRRFNEKKEWDVPIAFQDSILDEEEVQKVALMVLSSNHLDADIKNISREMLARTVTNAAVRSELIKDNRIEFFSFWNNEDDWIFAILCYKEAKKVYLLKECLYRYRSVEGSLNRGRRYIRDIYEKRKTGNSWIMGRIEELVPPSEKKVSEYRGILQRRLILTTFYNETAVKSPLKIRDSIKYIKKAVKEEKESGISRDFSCEAGIVERFFLLFILNGIILPVYLVNKFILKKYR